MAKQWVYRDPKDCKCEICVDNGFYLLPAQQIGYYPKGTPFSQRKFVPPIPIVCSCNKQVFDEEN